MKQCGFVQPPPPQPQPSHVCWFPALCEWLKEVWWDGNKDNGRKRRKRRNNHNLWNWYVYFFLNFLVLLFFSTTVITELVHESWWTVCQKRFWSCCVFCHNVLFLVLWLVLNTILRTRFIFFWFVYMFDIKRLYVWPLFTYVYVRVMMIVVMEKVI